MNSTRGEVIRHQQAHEEKKMPSKELTQDTEAARFHDMIASHPHLRVVGVEPATQTVAFHHLESNTTMEIPRLPEQLEDAGADDILGILEGRISPKRIHHITRIVGYFSRVEAWNKSKVAELRDRQKNPHVVPVGEYRVGGRAG
jgi:hypothetical protein